MLKLQLPLQQSYLLWRSSVVENSSDIKTSTLIKYDIMFQPRICETVSPPRKHWNGTYLPPWHYGIRRERSFPRISQVFYINSIKITLILISTLNHKSSMTCWNQLVTISLDNPCCILHWEISLYHYGWKITR